ncbi:hypothetical protein [Rhodococcus olei]|uniref:hypothetical protein n=1 Tax=Rhodococcus olei TaxID=2161675 RepID=UPI0031F0179C
MPSIEDQIIECRLQLRAAQADVTCPPWWSSNGMSPTARDAGHGGAAAMVRSGDRRENIGGATSSSVHFGGSHEEHRPPRRVDCGSADRRR